MRRLLLPFGPLLVVALALGVADAGGARAPRGPQLLADPLVVAPGDLLVLEGRGFPREARVTLLAGPPQEEATRIGGARTGRRGAFTATIRIRNPSDAGRYVVLACHDDCRVKARTHFRIAAP